MRQRLLDVEHERFGFGQAGGLDHDNFGRKLLHDLGYCGLEFTEQRAANAAAAQLRNTHVFAFNHFRVDGDLAEFIHHDCDLRRARGKDVPQQCRLAAAEGTSDESDGCAKHVKNDGVRMKNDELMTKPK